MRKKRALDPEKEAKWREIFRRFDASDLSFRKFCTRERINPNTFQYWRRELRKRDEENGVHSTISKGPKAHAGWDLLVESWKEKISCARANPAGVADYCRQNKIATQTLYEWLRRIKKLDPTWEPPPPVKGTETVSRMFVPVTLKSDEAVAKTSSRAPKQMKPNPAPKPRDSQSQIPSRERIELRLPSGCILSFPSQAKANEIVQVIRALESTRC